MIRRHVAWMAALPALLALLALADPATPRPVSAVTRAEIVAVPLARDTSGHIDFIAGSRTAMRVRAYDAAGHVVTPHAITWRTSNTNVVGFGAGGLLTAKARGYATVTATVDGIETSTRACVAARPRETLIPVVDSLVMDTPTLAFSRLGPAGGVRALAHIRFRIPGNWGACLHWHLDESTGSGASVTRDGVARINTTVTHVTVTGSLGPSIPY